MILYQVWCQRILNTRNQPRVLSFRELYITKNIPLYLVSLGMHLTSWQPPRTLVDWPFKTTQIDGLFITKLSPKNTKKPRYLRTLKQAQGRGRLPCSVSEDTKGAEVRRGRRPQTRTVWKFRPNKPWFISATLLIAESGNFRTNYGEGAKVFYIFYHTSLWLSCLNSASCCSSNLWKVVNVLTDIYKPMFVFT